MKNLALFFCFTFILSVSCEKNDINREKVTLTSHQYIDDLFRSGDTLWVISSRPGPFIDFLPVLPPYEISKINLSDKSILLSKEIPPSVSLALTKNGPAYLATFDRKILKLNSDLSTEELFAIPKINFIRMALCDKYSNLWIATADGGLYFYNGKDTLRFSSSNSILNNNWITSISLDPESNIWLIQGMDLFKIDNGRTVSKDPDQIPINQPAGVFDLASDNHSTLFCSKWDGNYHRLLKKELNKPWTMIDPPVSSNNRPVKFIRSDNNGIIWICYSDYPKDILAYFDNNNWVEIEIPLDEVNILDIETYNNELILGTSKGIYYMIKK